MNSKLRFVAAVAVALGIGSVGTNFAADPATDTKVAAAPEMKLPPGWTMDDMKACMLASTPGKMHEGLAKSVGEWTGKSTMWMVPDSEPATSDFTSTCSALFDGRFVKCEMKGDTPGMGPYAGFGIYGFDNVSQKFNCTWLDNHSTGMMVGMGELSNDGKTTTWQFTYNCPLTKKPAVMREVETWTSPNSKTLEMFGADPKSGKEFKMMRIELTRK